VLKLTTSFCVFCVNHADVKQLAVHVDNMAAAGETAKQAPALKGTAAYSSKLQ